MGRASFSCGLPVSGGPRSRPRRRCSPRGPTWSSSISSSATRRAGWWTTCGPTRCRSARTASRAPSGRSAWCRRRAEGTAVAAGHRSGRPAGREAGGGDCATHPHRRRPGERGRARLRPAGSGGGEERAGRRPPAGGSVLPEGIRLRGLQGRAGAGRSAVVHRGPRPAARGDREGDDRHRPGPRPGPPSRVTTTPPRRPCRWPARRRPPRETRSRTRDSGRWKPRCSSSPIP